MIKFPLGSQVFSVASGWGTVTGVGAMPGDPRYTVEVGDHCYTEDGKFDRRDLVPSLFTREEALAKFPEFPSPKGKVVKTRVVWLNLYHNEDMRGTAKNTKEACTEDGNELGIPYETREIIYTWEEEEK